MAIEHHSRDNLRCAPKPYEITWEGRVLYRRYTGAVRSNEAERSIADGDSDPRFDNVRLAINDFLDCESLELSPMHIEEIAAIASAAERSNPRVSIAFVVTNPEVRKILDAYVGENLNQSPTRFFSTVAEARAWNPLRTDLVVHYD